MENFWMYQAEKLEEEEAKWRGRSEDREEDEVQTSVWRLVDVPRRRTFSVGERSIIGLCDGKVRWTEVRARQDADKNLHEMLEQKVQT